MTPAKLKRLERVLSALKQADMVRLAQLRRDQDAAAIRAEEHRARARVTHPVVDAGDMIAQMNWARAELRRANLEDLARDAFSEPVAEAAAKLAVTFGREAALTALSEKLATEQARVDALRAEAEVIPGPPKLLGRRQRREGPADQSGPDAPSPGSSSTGLE